MLASYTYNQRPRIFVARQFRSVRENENEKWVGGVSELDYSNGIIRIWLSCEVTSEVNFIKSFIRLHI